MEKNGKMTKQKIGGIVFLALILLAVICGWREEEKRVAAEWEAAEKRVDASYGNEREEAELYWKLAENRISAMLLENESVERKETRKGEELFSDEWYAHGDRLADPYLYLFICAWHDENIAVSGDTDPFELDMTYLNVLAPYRAGDYPGYFLFSVWVKETDRGVEIGTDFHQKLFQQILYQCSDKNAWIAGISPSENWMEWVPLYDLLGEPVVMVSLTGDEDMEPVFRDACERMHARQEQIAGELGQDVRFGAVFDSHSLGWRNGEPEYEEVDQAYRERADYGRRKQKYDTYILEQLDVNGYRRWLGRYGGYYPVFHLDFHTGYDAEKQSIFQEMCVYRELYIEMWRAKQEKEEQEEEQEDAPQPQTWEVEAGDTLWNIAENRYGDGSL